MIGRQTDRKIVFSAFWLLQATKKVVSQPLKDTVNDKHCVSSDLKLHI